MNQDSPEGALSILSTDKQKILVVDDEVSIRRILALRLSMVGYDVVTASDGKKALEVFRLANPDLVVLDVMMPLLDGYGVCQELRKESDVPIIMLTALLDVVDRITGLELGADDYMVKPFSPKELESRIKALLRRLDKTNASTVAYSGIIRVGALRIDANRRQVYKDSQRVRLTEMEFTLLELLVSRLGKAVSRSEILQQVWGYTTTQYIDIRLVDVHISRLRAKLESDPSHPEMIRTARGIGYVFQQIIEPERNQSSDVEGLPQAKNVLESE